MKQKFITASSRKELDREVNGYLKEGWRVVAGTTYFTSAPCVANYRVSETAVPLPALSDGSSFMLFYSVAVEREDRL